MNDAPQINGSLRRILTQPTDGVVGLVDELLTFCGQHGLQLDCQADRIRVRRPASEWEELTGVVLRKSVFRAVLARIAELCNERTPNSVSPYNGNSALSVEVNPPLLFSVTFVNTPDEQRLEMQPVGALGTESPARKSQIVEPVSKSA